ncbi:hypothetical protein FRC03_009068 [Tulasnella sp. 419]|nr:hypothetical protein FRC02_004507 [Tulasnella sp. 418]KAG8967933.1 hypothetical protein FRC03_009068 [Tulasnella sp. 419]
MIFLSSLLIVTLLSPLITAAPAPKTHTIALDAGSVTGYDDGSLFHYRSIPFAYPPIGDRRLRPPEPLPPYDINIDATKFGPSCPNQVFHAGWKGFLGGIADRIIEWWYYTFRADNSDEDCLSLNVIAPKTANSSSSLPVIVWIYGGAFLMGSTEGYKGENIVKRSTEIGQPVIYVSINYRIGVLGFLPGIEVKNAGAGNLGLRDQRLGLRWVQKYIREFGGDPEKVTIWGQSAGAMSVGMHMLTNDGNHEGLFRAAVMQSGAPIPVGDITVGQPIYDKLVSKLKCSDKPDTLQCIREAKLSTLKKAANSVVGWYYPRVDGDFLKEPPYKAVQNGRVANVPYITGTVGDEGSLFALLQLGLDSEELFAKYLATRFLPNATPQEVVDLAGWYQIDPQSTAHQHKMLSKVLTKDFWRIAEVEGDFMFNAPKRFFLQNTWNKAGGWNYLSLKGDSRIFGSHHTSELDQVFKRGAMQDYVIRFSAHGDPNIGPGSSDLIKWPKWDPNSNTTLIIRDGTTHLSIEDDINNPLQLDYVNHVALKYPV